MTQAGGRWIGQHRRRPSVVRHRRKAGPGAAMGVLIGMIAFAVIVALSVATSAGMPTPAPGVGEQVSSSPEPTGSATATEVVESSAAATVTPPSKDRPVREPVVIESRRCRGKPNEGVSP